MTDLRLIIRRLRKGDTLSEISADLKVSRTSIRNVRDRAIASGWDYAQLEEADDPTLYSILRKEGGHRKTDDAKLAILEPLLEEYARRMQQKHATYEGAYYYYLDNVGADNAYGKTQFKDLLKQYEKAHDYSYHNHYSPAGEMQVDFAGDKLYVTDAHTGEVHDVSVLICVLPFSMMIYAMGMFSTKMEHFFNALSLSLEYFGGVPETVKSDNMKQWVKKYDPHEPVLTDAVTRWGLHYGTQIDNCRVRRPRDKGPVESAVNQVYKYIYSRMGNDVFHSLTELNSRLLELVGQYNGEIMKSHGYSRIDKFSSEEKPFLLPLPKERFRFTYEKKFTVNSTYHVGIPTGNGKLQHFYSIPYMYLTKEAKAVYDCDSVEIWIDMKRVAMHRRKFVDGWTTLADHMPERHREYEMRKKCYNAAYYLHRASQIGPATKEVIQGVLDSKPFLQQAYKTCAAIIRLATIHSSDRLEKACSMLPVKTSVSYASLKSMLDGKLDTAQCQDASSSYIPHNEDVRGAETYR